MVQERLEAKTLAFFNRPAQEVALELAQRAYTADQKEKQAKNGQPKEVQIPTEEGDRSYKVLLAQAYAENDAMQTWKGKRLQQIRTLTPGQIITFRSRVGILSFIKTTAGENILIRAVENTETGEKFETATKVSNLLGLSHGEIGRLRFTNGSKLRFERLW